MIQQAEPFVRLIAHTPDPVTVCTLAARVCYSALPYDELSEKASGPDQVSFLKGVIRSGHLSVLEHASFTFYVEGVSRSLLAQLTRHRIASFSVQSQRYVSLKDRFSCVGPPRISALGSEKEAEYLRQMETIGQWYEEWQEAFDNDPSANEDARFVLPNACATRLVMTMNARELRHFFSLRMCERAQWEIRALATEMHRLCMEVAPALFRDAGPGCLQGKCPEGEKSCGKAKEKREERQRLIEDMQKSKKGEPEQQELRREL